MMGSVVGGRICECTLCGREFMGKCGQALYFHMKADHGLDHGAAYAEAGASLDNNVSFFETDIKGAAF